MLSRYLETVAGDTLSFRIVLREGASPVDVATLNFTGGVKHAGSNSGTIVNFNFEVIDPTAGIVRVFLNPDQTRFLQNTSKMYEWYVRVEDGEYKRTLGFGALKAVVV